ncbi:MAG: hypothetical protein ROO71_09020 [Balneola sp.]
MKATNEQITIETQHMISKKMFSWKLADHAIPAEAHLQNRTAALRKKYQSIVKENQVPTLKDGSVDFEKISEELSEQLTDISLKILKMDMDRLACVLNLNDELPEGYDNERELLEECIGAYEVIHDIMAVFTKRSGSTISLPEHGKGLIRFKRPNGQIFDPLATNSK